MKNTLLPALFILLATQFASAQFGGLVNKARQATESKPANNNNNSGNSSTGSTTSEQPGSNASNTGTEQRGSTGSSGEESGSSASQNSSMSPGLAGDIIDKVNTMADGAPNRSPITFTVTYAQYQEAKAVYTKSDEAMSYYLKMIPTCDEFFDKQVEAYLNRFEMPGIRRLIPESVAQKKDDPEFIMRRMNQEAAILDVYLKMIKPGAALEPELKMWKDSATSQAAWIDNFIKSGEYEKYKNEKNAAAVKNRKFPPVFGSNPTWEAGAKAAVANAYKASNITIVKAAITNNQWHIIKNDIGLPDYRAQIVTVGFKLDGKCYTKDCEVRQDYAGGGTYNTAVTYETFGYEKQEIGCDQLGTK